MKIKKVLTTLIITGALSLLFAGTAFASGGVYVSDDYLELENGSSANVSITFDNAAGYYTVSSSGSVYANDEGFLDDESSSIGISTTGTGYGEVIISLADVSTYDEEDLSGETIVIEVNVIDPEDGDTDYGKGEDENSPDEKSDDSNTDEKQSETKSDKLDVKINNKEYTILTNFKGIDIPKGFAEKEVTFEGEKVKVLQYKELLKLYALKNKSDKTVLFFTYDDTAKQFKQPLAMTQGKKTYYFLDIPADTDITGYQKKEVSINGEKVPALISDYSGMEDYCFVYALSDGEENFYCVDQKENTIQRVDQFSIPLVDHEKLLDAKKVSIFDNVYVLIGAGVMLAIFILLFILLIISRKKYKEALEDNYDAYYDATHNKPEEYYDRDDDLDFDESIDYEETINSEKGKDKDDLDDIFFDDLNQNTPPIQTFINLERDLTFMVRPYSILYYF